MKQSGLTWLTNAVLDAAVFALDLALQNAVNEKTSAQRTVDEYYQSLRDANRR